MGLTEEYGHWGSFIQAQVTVVLVVEFNVNESITHI